MSDREDNGEAVESSSVVNGGPEVEEQVSAIQPIIVRLPSPTHPRTLPKGSKENGYSTLTILPQPNETIQELKLAINEWIGGYWLGPYALRIPQTGTAITNGDAPNGHTEKKKGDVKTEICPGERLSDYLEVGDVFIHHAEGEERVLEVVREPYTDFTARQTVLRLIEVISPAGTTSNRLSTPAALSPATSIYESIRDGVSAAEPVYEEVEVALAGKKGKGKKEIMKVKREAPEKAHAFADWTERGSAVSLANLPMSQPAVDTLPCVKSIQMSPFNPPPAHLRQKGHQLYLQVTTLEGDVLTLICSSRGWFVSKSNVNRFDAAPRDSSPPSHSLLDLLHSQSPLFSERLALLPPLSAEPPKLEPITTVPIPQSEPAYPWLVSLPKSPEAEILRTQMAYLHTGATTAEGLDCARDWNEEIQGVRELPRATMQERVVREKIAQKTWAEFTSASVRSVLAVARGDVPPLNPNEEARAHMFLHSNIFITKAVDSIDAYSHVGGDAAAHVNHAKDAVGVKLLNKLDVDGVSMLGHTVVDWEGERWVCQSVLPGIFGRRISDEEKEIEGQTEEKKEDTDGKEWINVNGSPQNSADGEEAVAADDKEEPNPLIIYGYDSETSSIVHYDAVTHKLMRKIADAYHLAPHNISDGEGVEREFYASADVKGLKGMDGRRYLLDLPRLMPVDVEFLQKDLEGPAINGGEAGKYPHRVVLLRPELVETYWESELKRWARGVVAEQAKSETESAEQVEPKKEEAVAEIDEDKSTEDLAPAASSFASQRAEAEKPLPTAIDSEELKNFELRFNPDAFVDLPPSKDDEAPKQEPLIDEAQPAVKAVRDASVFLRSVAIPALALDVLTGATTGIMDGASLSRIMHARGINIRYLGYVLDRIGTFSQGSDGQPRGELGHLDAFRRIVKQELVFRASKHVLRRLVSELSSEHVPAAVSHFLNCLLGTAFNPSPKASFEAITLDSDEPTPAYVELTPESLRAELISEIQTRYRWTMSELDLSDVRKTQLLRELAMRTAFQLVQRDYAFEQTGEVDGHASEEDKTVAKKDKKDKKVKIKAKSCVRTTTFEPEDVVCWVPVVKSTSPGCSVAEEIFDAGRATINRGSVELGLDFLLESVQIYENVHQFIHPEVASIYNQYASTIHQLARLKIAQVAQAAAQGDGSEADQPLGIDITTALKLQRQAVIIAERTLGVWHAETISYYFNLAMLENLDGNVQASLRYLRHVMDGWEVIYGKGHPETATVLSNAAIILQSLPDPSLSLTLLTQSHALTVELFGDAHLQTAQSMHQLTQAHFLSNDVPAALASATEALAIFEKRLGADHAQTKEASKNVELLKAVVEGFERQKTAVEEQKKRQLERLHAAQARVGSSAARKRLGSGILNGSVGNSTSTGATGTSNAQQVVSEETSRIGERGHLDVDELVRFIQGSPAKTSSTRGSKGLRGKRRTGAKR
ncbi:putative eukaryotic translation initiation factor 3 subunit [Naematelia encephala]|uniref:Putative eukaryotic translation initiation factor 3 subunit n=1 Tax=Naematelia encephala TaxID=71784 RepID=A0A1Y2BHS3_9TREE|nr:putative eukaryotic translation initiation factor 3 subunit [Naematelia encephala]